MEDKDVLMMEMQKEAANTRSIESAILQIKKDIETNPSRFEEEKVATLRKQQDAFNSRQQKQLDDILQVIEKKKQEVSDLVDSYPENERKEIAGRVEIKDLEEHLMEIYPQELIEGYTCLNPIDVETDDEAYKLYQNVERSIARLQNGSIAGIIFSAMMGLLDKTADKVGGGGRVAFAIFLLTTAVLIFAPFAFIAFSVITGSAAIAHGVFVKQLLRELYSVKRYMENTYDTELFAETKSDIEEHTNKFFDETFDDFADRINSRTFKPDEEEMKSIKKRYDLERQRLDVQLQEKEHALEVSKQKQQAMIDKLRELEELESQRAKNAEKEYLTGVDWKREWLSKIFLGVTDTQQMAVLDWEKENNLFFGKDIEDLQRLSKLIIYQHLLKVSPDFATSKVFDYKYNGGPLTQFLDVGQACIDIALDEESITKKMESVSNIIRSRVRTVLGSCESLEDFNKLMATYDSAGEYYIMVHIFGLSSMNPKLVKDILNGPRVGVIFNLYATKDEFESIGNDFDFTLFKHFYKVDEWCRKSNAERVRSFAGFDS